MLRFQLIILTLLGIGCSDSEEVQDPISTSSSEITARVPMEISEPLDRETSKWVYQQISKRGFLSFSGNKTQKVPLECHWKDEDDPCYFTKGWTELQKFPEEISEKIREPLRESRADLGDPNTTRAYVACHAIDASDPPFELESVSCELSKAHHPKEEFLPKNLAMIVSNALRGDHAYKPQSVLTGSIRCWWSELRNPSCVTRQNPTNNVEPIPEKSSLQLSQELKDLIDLDLQPGTDPLYPKQLVAAVYCEVDSRPVAHQQPRHSMCRIRITQFQG